MTTFMQVAPAFAATDFEALVKFYVDVMGFEPRFKTDIYAVLYRDGVMMLHIYPAQFEQKQGGNNSAYFFVTGVDEFHDSIRHRVNIVHPIKDQDYGLRDFGFRDPEGNNIGIAQRL